MIDKDAIQFEQHWRKKIADEVKELLWENHELNAYGVYLFLKNKADNA
jgi:hypothetical protein